MDIDYILKAFSRSQRSIFIAFIIHLPIVYALFFLIYPSFKTLDIIDKSIFSAAVSIAITSFSYLASLYVCHTLNPNAKTLPIIFICYPIIYTFGISATMLAFGDPPTIASVYDNFFGFIIAVILFTFVYSLHRRYKH